MRMKDVETVTYLDLRSSRDLRGPVLGLLLLRTGERIALTDQPLSTVGSDPACDVVVEDDPHVSGVHTLLERRGSELHAFDYESKNGLWINDARVAASELGVGARLRVGATTFLAYGPGIAHDDFATPSEATFIRGQLEDYGGNAARAARGIGITARAAQRKRRALALDPDAIAAARVTTLEDSIPIAIHHDPMIIAGRKRRV
jgi:hypothetical protein